MEKLKPEKTSQEKMQEFIDRGFIIIDDTVYSSEVGERGSDLCPCCNEPLAGKVLERIKFKDTGEEILIHRYHQGTNLDHREKK
jgi:hypothetical protein